MKVTAPALRYHGAKFRLAPWIIAMFPPHQCYVEPFGGAAGVLLRKPRSYAEVYNDLDGDVVNFFRVLRDPVKCRSLVENLIKTPYAREEFEAAWEAADNDIERARHLAIRAHMGFGSAGATKGSTGFRIDTKRKYGTAQHLWAAYPAAIEAAALRFEGVMIENKNAVEVMLSHDCATTLHYVDPPYVHSTRMLHAETSKGNYRHELSDGDHMDLLCCLKNLKGMVIVSGYDSEIYRESLGGWQIESIMSRIASARGAALRREFVWINPAAAAAQRAHGLKIKTGSEEPVLSMQTEQDQQKSEQPR